MSLIDTIRTWQAAWAHNHDLETLGFEEIEAIARDIGVPADVLASLAAHGPDAGAELYRLMKELSLDADAVARGDGALMRDMSITCSNCQDVGRCRRDLDRGSASSHFTEYCPNGDTLQELQRSAASA